MPHLTGDQLVDLTALDLQLAERIIEILVAVLALLRADEDDLGTESAARGLRSSGGWLDGAELTRWLGSGWP